MTTRTSPQTATAEQVEHLVLMATYAPSVHNTQPWLFETTVDGVLVRADRSRQLAVLDPYGRDLALSCGAAVHHLQVAARATGLDADVVLLPHADRPDDLAQVRVRPGAPATEAERETAVAVLHRHTERGRFPDEALPDEVLERLRVAVEGQGAMLRVVRDAELVELEVLLSHAEQELLRTPGYAAELDRWVWRAAQGPDEPRERADGLPAEAVDHGPDRAESLQGRRFEAAAAAGPAVRRSSEPPVPEHPTVVVVTTLRDEPQDWLQAGRALSALLLEGAQLGVLAQPLSQVVETPATRAALRRLLGTVGVPQMMLRLGAGTNAPLTPRRPVADVLTVGSPT